MGRLYQEWRRLRDQAGELLYLVAKADKLGHGDEAEKTYEDWRKGLIGFEEAKRRLNEILARAQAAARVQP